MDVGEERKVDISEDLQVCGEITVVKEKLRKVAVQKLAEVKEG